MMGSRRVVALVYRVVHGKSHDYSKAEPLEKNGPGFLVRIENEEVQFKFKDGYDTEEDARKAVEDFIRNWEFDACLKGGDKCFKLEYEKAIKEASRPTPGEITVDTTPIRLRFEVSPAVGIVGHPKHPSPPQGISLSPDVETLYARYMGYRNGKEPLASMANFCITVLKASARAKCQKRSAAKFYNISCNVLDRIGDLSANRGGQEARKANGIATEFSSQERHFLEQAIRVIIRRMAETEYDENQPVIDLSDFPSLK